MDFYEVLYIDLSKDVPDKHDLSKKQKDDFLCNDKEMYDRILYLQTIGQ